MLLINRWEFRFSVFQFNMKRVILVTWRRSFLDHDNWYRGNLPRSWKLCFYASLGKRWFEWPNHCPDHPYIKEKIINLDQLQLWLRAAECWLDLSRYHLDLSVNYPWLPCPLSAVRCPLPAHLPGFSGPGLLKVPRSTTLFDILAASDQSFDALLYFKIIMYDIGAKDSNSDVLSVNKWLADMFLIPY